MEYKKGHKIKPYMIHKNGLVDFTDGTTNTLQANEDTCKAYGYKYDKDKGVCRAFIIDSKVTGLASVNVENSNSKIGSNISLGKSSNSLIVGDSHTLSQDRNCFVSGRAHNISDRISNSSIIGGTYGNSTHNGEVVIGGGIGDDSVAGQIQTSIVSLYGETTGLDITLYTQGDDVKQEQIYLPSNSISIYEVCITGLCTGGSSGTAGDYKTKRIMGSLLVENSGSITKTESLDTDLGNSGTTGNISLDVSTSNIFSVQCSASANVSVNWSAVVKLYINQTKVEI